MDHLGRMGFVCWRDKRCAGPFLLKICEGWKNGSLEM